MPRPKCRMSGPVEQMTEQNAFKNANNIIEQKVRAFLSIKVISEMVHKTTFKTKNNVIINIFIILTFLQCSKIHFCSSK
jgi:hypothetical protein